MAIDLISYVPETGRILAVVYPPDNTLDLYLEQHPELVPTEVADVSYQTHYVNNGQVVVRPASTVTRDGLWLHGLLPGSTLYIDDSPYDVTETSVELDFALSGTYQLRVDEFPRTGWQGSVTV
jgi:hypothetical protein